MFFSDQNEPKNIVILCFYSEKNLLEGFLLDIGTYICGGRRVKANPQFKSYTFTIISFVLHTLLFPCCLVYLCFQF